MSDKILKIVGRYIYDSRGNPTVEVDLWTSKGTHLLLFYQLILFYNERIIDFSKRNSITYINNTARKEVDYLDK